MTGPEHYARAEELLAATMRRGVFSEGSEPIVAVAQVHATLALAAATALGLRGETANTYGGMSTPESDRWAAVLGSEG